jgi:predicted Zn-dependent peptidase
MTEQAKRAPDYEQGGTTPLEPPAARTTTHGSAPDFLPRPELAPPGVWSFPTPTRARLDNGIDTVVFTLPGQHVISANLVLDIPLNAEDPDREGVATICARVLDEGTRAHDGEEFAELLETEGAGFGVELSLAGLQAVLDVPASNLEPALQLFAEAVREPTLGARDVNRHVQLRLAEIEQAQANSAQTASIAFRSAVFDEASRASRMNGGEPETVARLDQDSVAAFHAAQFGPARATLILAGDFPTDPLPLVERCFRSWQNPDQQAVPTQAPSPNSRRLILVDRPGAVQADIRYGGFGTDRLDPRWSDITVAGYAMGGAFLSRLNAVLREDKGYTYGVRMNFMPLHVGGSFAVQGSFRTEVVVDALSITQDLIDVSGTPFTTREVDEAVAYLTGVSPLRYATADGVADQAATQVLAGLPDDYVDRSLALLRSVTPETATAAYTSLVRPDDLSLVVVGDAERLADPLRGLGFDDLVVVPAE